MQRFEVCSDRRPLDPVYDCLYTYVFTNGDQKMRHVLEMTETEFELVHEILPQWFSLDPFAADYLARKSLTPADFEEFLEKVNEC